MDITISESRRCDPDGARVPTDLSQLSGEGATPMNWTPPRDVYEILAVLVMQSILLHQFFSFYGP